MAQNIDAIFFSPDTERLSHEYEQLYSSLFSNPEPYMKVVTALAKKNKGLTREEIVKASGIPTGGDLSRYLNELEWCGFIRKYTNIGIGSSITL